MKVRATERERKREKYDNSPTGSLLRWMKPGGNSFFKVFHLSAGAQALEISSATFPNQDAVARSGADGS